jgi:BirA family biotin operon repressor/biotin-[acetyl-CoA-carboxylase] ligase
MKDFENKKKIISYFRAKGLDYVSGEGLSEELGFSRANVWKYMTKLRDEGYIIEAVPHLGYRLMSSPDKILPYEIDVDLKTRVFGKTAVHCYDDISSTNNEAYRLAEEGAGEGALVLAETQSRGKGRIGRKWVSPKGSGIYMSLILRPDVEIDEIPSITLVVASAIAKVIRKECSLDAMVKWPNDIFVGGKKVCGILTEMKAQTDSVDFLILGIGINVNTSSAKLPPEATSLSAQASKTFDRTILLRRFLEELERDYLKFSSNGFAALRDECRSSSLVLGGRVNVTEHHKRIEGEAVDIDEKGALIVRTAGGELKRVFSGDVVMCR